MSFSRRRISLRASMCGPPWTGPSSRPTCRGDVLHLRSVVSVFHRRAAMPVLHRDGAMPVFHRRAATPVFHRQAAVPVCPVAKSVFACQAVMPVMAVVGRAFRGAPQLPCRAVQLPLQRSDHAAERFGRPYQQRILGGVARSPRGKQFSLPGHPKLLLAGPLPSAHSVSKGWANPFRSMIDRFRSEMRKYAFL
jgi:hypothetical protein